MGVNPQSRWESLHHCISCVFGSFSEQLLNIKERRILPFVKPIYECNPSSPILCCSCFDYDYKIIFWIV